MITKFKIFENINDEPKIGDYVICEERGDTNLPEIIKKFVSSNIGVIQSSYGDDRFFNVYYENIDSRFSSMTKAIYFNNTGVRDMSRSEIKYWSENRGDLEAIIKSNKFNL